MSARTRAIVIAVTLALFAAACSSGGGEKAAPTTTSSTTGTAAEVTTTSISTTSTTTTSTTVADTTTTTAEPEGPTTPADLLASDGITSPEDAAVFVLTSWIAADRPAASRHAEGVALDSLFAAQPPALEALELIECDTADLIRYDCFFAADGEIIIVGVERLRVLDATIDRD